MGQTFATEKPAGESLVCRSLSGRGEDGHLSERREEDILTLRVVGRPGGGDTGGTGGPRLTARIAGHRSECLTCTNSVNRHGNPGASENVTPPFTGEEARAQTQIVMLSMESTRS